jgi:hypothetical protein
MEHRDEGRLVSGAFGADVLNGCARRDELARLGAIRRNAGSWLGIRDEADGRTGRHHACGGYGRGAWYSKHEVG